MRDEDEDQVEAGAKGAWHHLIRCSAARKDGARAASRGQHAGHPACPREAKASTMAEAARPDRKHTPPLAAAQRCQSWASRAGRDGGR